MDRKRLIRSPLLWVAVIFVAYLLYSYLSDDTRNYKVEPTSVAVAQLSGGNVVNAVFTPDSQRVATSRSSWSVEISRRSREKGSSSVAVVSNATMGAPSAGQVRWAGRRESSVGSCIVAGSKERIEFA